jgi:hypothetical protein
MDGPTYSSRVRQIAKDYKRELEAFPNARIANSLSFQRAKRAVKQLGDVPMGWILELTETTILARKDSRW